MVCLSLSCQSLSGYSRLRELSVAQASEGLNLIVKVRLRTLDGNPELLLLTISSERLALSQEANPNNIEDP